MQSHCCGYPLVCSIPAARDDSPAFPQCGVDGLPWTNPLEPCALRHTTAGQHILLAEDSHMDFLVAITGSIVDSINLIAVEETTG